MASTTVARPGCLKIRPVDSSGETLCNKTALRKRKRQHTSLNTVEWAAVDLVQTISSSHDAIEGNSCSDWHVPPSDDPSSCTGTMLAEMARRLYSTAQKGFHLTLPWFVLLLRWCRPPTVQNRCERVIFEMANCAGLMMTKSASFEWCAYFDPKFKSLVFYILNGLYRNNETDKWTPDRALHVTHLYNCTRNPSSRQHLNLVLYLL